MTGIDNPTISVGPHKDLIVKWSLAAQNLCRRRGIDPRRAGHAIAAGYHADRICVNGRCQDPAHVRNEQAEGNLYALFSCMVAANFIDLSRPQSVDLDQAPSADYWATIAEPEDFGAMELACWTAIKKALEAQRKIPQVVAPPKGDKSLAS